MAKKELAKKEESNVVSMSVMDMLLEDAGSASEGMSKDDMMIPRLSILQQMSPQINKRDGAYVDGAEAGHIYDNVSNEVYDGENGITVVPISYRRAHIEWKADRGGLVNDHGSDSACLDNCTRGSRGEYLTDEGNEIVPTGEYFVYVVEDDGNYSPAMLSMSKSQLKRARQWNSMINRLQVPHPQGGGTINPAMFWNAYTLSTVPEENDQGSWFGWSVKMKFDAKSGGILKNNPNGTEIYLAARDFKQQVASGVLKPTGPVNDNEVPF